MPDPFMRDPVLITPDEALARLPEVSDQVGLGQAPSTLVMVHSQGLFELVAESLEASELSHRVGPAPLHLSESFDGIGVLTPGVGGTAAAYALERCIAAGTERVFSLGFASALAPHAEAGDVCLIEAAIPEDGVTNHYAGPGYHPEADQGLTRTLRDGLEWGRQGSAWSTSAPYRQSLDALERVRKAEAIAVDMTAAPILTVASYRGVPAGVVRVAGEVIQGEELVAADQEAIDTGVRTAVRGLVSVMKGIRNLNR